MRRRAILSHRSLAESSEINGVIIQKSLLINDVNYPKNKSTKHEKLP